MGGGGREQVIRRSISNVFCWYGTVLQVKSHIAYISIHAWFHSYTQTHTHTQVRVGVKFVLRTHWAWHSLHKALIRMQSVDENKQWLKHPKGKIFKNPKNNKYIINNMHSHSCKTNCKERKRVWVSQITITKQQYHDEDVQHTRGKLKFSC